MRTSLALALGRLSTCPNSAPPSIGSMNSRLAAPPLYTSLWDFEARTPTEISFRAGELFQVTWREGEWWWAKKVDGSHKVLAEGYVPSNYLAEQETMEAEPWFFGPISRSESLRRLLSGESKTGSFLIRISEKKEAAYVLSVRDDSIVRHYKIWRNAQGQLYMNAALSFPDLLSLVEHYKAKSLSHGLKMTVPCWKEDTVQKEDRNKNAEKQNTDGERTCADVYNLSEDINRCLPSLVKD